MNMQNSSGIERQGRIRGRVFLLLQGKGGPAVIRYGRLSGEPEAEKEGRQMIQFEAVVDPTTQVLASREDLLAIDGSDGIWSTQRSGIKLEEPIATQMEALVIGSSPRPQS